MADERKDVEEGREFLERVAQGARRYDARPGWEKGVFAEIKGRRKEMTDERKYGKHTAAEWRARIESEVRADPTKHGPDERYALLDALDRIGELEGEKAQRILYDNLFKLYDRGER
jgi:hypothetical protein